MGICSIAFPSIPAGVYSYPLGQAAKIAIQTVVKYVQKYNEDFDRVVWVLFDNNTFRTYYDELATVIKDKDLKKI
jgi:O-acetyl-ADP-ribose deacetylase (regulator of RNase III)